MNNNRNISTFSPFITFCQHVIPLAYDESMSYYETLCALRDYLVNTVIPAVNNNADAVTELQNAFNTLQNYVDNYFNNLDVQNEINNKLDEMAKDGTLTNIIAAYLEINSILAYNTKNDLKNANNLNDGSFTKTYGNISYNDGFGAFYKIRKLVNTDEIDEDKLIGLTNYPDLVAEKMPNNIKITNVLYYGAKGDGITDDTTAIINAINNNDIIYFPKGDYLITNTIEIKGKSLIGTPFTNLIINSDVDIFKLGFHTKIKYFNIYNKVESYSHNIFEISSNTLTNEKIINYTDIEISNLFFPYFDNQPTQSTGTLFLIYATKTEANQSGENNSQGFWGVNIHDITSFQYFKYLIRHYYKISEKTTWLTSNTFKNITSMRNNYFWFGKENDNNFDATDFKDGDAILFDNCTVQYDFMMKYAFFFTSGWKKIVNSRIWDFPLGQQDKMFTFSQQVTNTTQYPIEISNMPYDISEACNILNGGNSLLALLSTFSYIGNVNYKTYVNNNLNGLLLNPQNKEVYYKLGKFNYSNFLTNIIILQDPETFDVGQSATGVSIKCNTSSGSPQFKITSLFGTKSFQNFPTFYYKNINENGIDYIELYCMKYGGNNDSTSISNVNIIGQIKENNRIAPIDPIELSETPTGITEITNVNYISNVGVQNTITQAGNDSNVGGIGYELSTRQFKICDQYGWNPIQTVMAGSSRPNRWKYAGLQYFDTSINKLIIWNGSRWVDTMGNNV